MALLVVALGCNFGRGPEPPPTPTPTPEPVADIRETVVSALQRPGSLVRVDIHIQPGEGGNEETLVSWLDLAGRRARVHDLREGIVQRITIILDGSLAHYDRESNNLSRTPVLLGPQLGRDLPPSLKNPALLGLPPLVVALWRARWQPGGEGEWAGQPVTIWRADYTGVDADFSTTIYLDARTNLPVAQEVERIPRTDDSRPSRFVVTYRVQFVGLEALPERPFEVEALEALQQRFGGKLEEARQVGLPLLWLGRSIRLGEKYPTLALRNIHVRRADDPRGAFVGLFYYTDPQEETRLQGEVHILIWPRSLWEQEIEPRVGAGAWWREPGVEKVPITVAGRQGEYALRPEPSPEATRQGQPPQATEVILWLPDTVVRIGATPILLPLTPPSPPGGPPSQRRGGYVADINPFNSTDALRLVLETLVPLD